MIDLSIPVFTIPEPPFHVSEAAGSAAVYCRVSGQDDPRTASLATQAQACIAMAHDHKLLVSADRVFFERQSGFQSEDDRPKLIEIKQRVQEGEIQALIVYATDRLSRSDDLKFIVRWLERRRCKVYFVTFDRQEGHFGDFMLDLMSFTSTHERVSILDRTQRGRDSVKEIGRMLGCGPCRYGYRWESPETRNRVRDPETAWVVELIFDLVGNKGWSTIQVAKHLKAEGIPSPYMTRPKRRTNRVTEWTPQRVAFICRERSYLGLSLEKRSVPVLDENGEKVKVGPTGRKRTLRRLVGPAEMEEAGRSKTEALVSQELFDRCAVSLASRVRKATYTRNQKEFWLLRGMVVCGSCGYRMTPHFSTPSKAAMAAGKPSRCYYKCNTTSAVYARPKRDCSARLARKESLEQGVWDFVEGIIRQPAIVERAIDDATKDGNAQLIESELNDVTKDLRATRKKLDQYTEAYAEATNATLRKAVEAKVGETERAIAELSQREIALKSRLTPYLDIAKTRDATMKMVELFNARLDDPDYLTPLQKRQIIEALGIEVITLNGEFSIRLQPPATLSAVVVSDSTTRRRWDNHNTFVVHLPGGKLNSPRSLCSV